MENSDELTESLFELAEEAIERLRGSESVGMFEVNDLCDRLELLRMKWIGMK